TLSTSTTEIAQPGDTGSMDVNYSIPPRSGVSQVVFFPNANDQIDVNPAGQRPTAIGFWIKGAGGSGTDNPLDKGVLTFAESWIEINGQTATIYPTAVTYNGWRLVTAAVPAGAQLPLSINFLDFLVINPAQQLSGDLYISDMQALFFTRQPATQTYT